MSVGPAVGEVVVGVPVGELVGVSVGLNVGEPVGTLLGTCVGDGVGAPVGRTLGTEVGDGVGQLPHMTRQIAATAPSLQSVTPVVPQTSRSGEENPGHLGVAVGASVGHELQVTGHVAETFESPQLLAKHPAGSGAP